MADGAFAGTLAIGINAPGPAVPVAATVVPVYPAVVPVYPVAVPAVVVSRPMRVPAVAVWPAPVGVVRAAYPYRRHVAVIVR